MGIVVLIFSVCLCISRWNGREMREAQTSLEKCTIFYSVTGIRLPNIRSEDEGIFIYHVNILGIKSSLISLIIYSLLINQGVKENSTN